MKSRRDNSGRRRGGRGGSIKETASERGSKDSREAEEEEKMDTLIHNARRKKREVGETWER